MAIKTINSVYKFNIHRGEDKVLGTSFIKKIQPCTRIELGPRKVCKEIIIDDILPKEIF